MDLFMSLFNVQTTQQSMGPTPGSAQTLGSPEPEVVNRQNSNNSASSIGSSGQGRVTSIDSDASSGMDLDRHNTLSPHEFLGERGGDSAFTPVKGAGGKSQDSYQAHGSGMVDISKLTSQGSTVTLNSAHSSLDTELNQSSDPRDHEAHNSMHVFVNAQHKAQQKQQQQHQQQIPLQLASPTPKKAITNGSPDLSSSREPNPSSPNPRAATKLAEALQKLRQVFVFSFLLVQCIQLLYLCV
jgi:hypothetical protein